MLCVVINTLICMLFSVLSQVGTIVFIIFSMKTLKLKEVE